MTAINRVQAAILHRLFEQDGLRFSEINTDGLPTDQFSFHLRQLSKAGLIEKLPDQTYRLTAQGKSRTIMLTPGQNRFIEQGFSAVLVVARKYTDGQWRYLLQTRNKVPYKGLISTSGDKILYGETVQAAAERALLAQTGLAGNVSLCSIWHIRDIHQGDVVQDKFFYVHAADDCQGQEFAAGLTGHNVWMGQAEIARSSIMIANSKDILDSLESPDLSFHEAVYEVAEY